MFYLAVFSTIIFYLISIWQENNFILKESFKNKYDFISLALFLLIFVLVYLVSFDRVLEIPYIIQFYIATLLILSLIIVVINIIKFQKKFINLFLLIVGLFYFLSILTILFFAIFNHPIWIVLILDEILVEYLSLVYWFFSAFYLLKISLSSYINVKEKEFLEIEKKIK